MDWVFKEDEEVMVCDDGFEFKWKMGESAGGRPAKVEKSCRWSRPCEGGHVREDGCRENKQKIKEKQNKRILKK